MSEVIDVMVKQSVDSLAFTVNTGTTYVTPAVIGFNKIVNGQSHQLFKAGDNFSILSVGLILPESFCLYKSLAIVTPLAALEIRIRDLAGGIYIPEPFGATAPVLIPMENYECAIDVFIDVTQLQNTIAPFNMLSADFYIETKITNTLISMYNIPAAYNTKTFQINEFLKILHNHRIL